MNNDDQKIVWKHNDGTDSNQVPDTETSQSGSDISPLEITDQALSHNADIGNGNQASETENISDLQAEIAKAFETPEEASASESLQPATLNTVSEPTTLDNLTQGTPQETPGDTLELTQEPTVFETPTTTDDTQEVRNIQQDIQEHFAEKAPIESEPVEVKRGPSGLATDTGIEQTYYSDLSDAMGSNEPATMSELLRKARFEKKQAAILSPRSRKNVLYIVGALLLFFGVFGLISMIFGGKNPVTYITDERVSSLVYSDLDTGINTTDLEESKTKQAIRKVLGQRLEEDTIRQVYYARKDDNGTIRRLGVKEIFDKTNSQAPDSMYANIENEFMHGVYKTDKNYPFLIFKVLSYDRALDALYEWEPTMIDDLSPYLNLPPEASDRSLIEDGFSDDLIKNKNVRIARYIPRSRDRLEGILNRITGTPEENIGVTDTPVDPTESGDEATSTEGGDSTTSTETTTTTETTQETTIIEQVSSLFKKFVKRIPRRVHAQQNPFSQTTSTGTQLICYEKQKICTNTQTGAFVSSALEGQANISCVDSVKNGPNDEVFGPELHGDPDYQCISTGSETFSDGIVTDDVCFDRFTGNRLRPADVRLNKPADPGYAEMCTGDNPQGFVFPSYQCNLVQCFEGNRPVPFSEKGKPGVECRETDQSVERDSELPKQCYQFNELLGLQNISQTNLCFDQQGNYLSGVTEPSNGIKCVSPLNHSSQMCLTQDKRVVPFDPRQPAGYYTVCFNTTENFNEGEFTGIGDRLRQQAATIGFQLRTIAGMAQFFGVGRDTVATLNETADFFFDIAYANILEVEAVQRASNVVFKLELILNQLDPQQTWTYRGPDGEVNFLGRLRDIIAFIKDLFGLHNLTWINLSDNLPTNQTFYAGQTTEGVDVIQQALGLIGFSLTPTGQLNLPTQEAIGRVQLLNNLTHTGIVDPQFLNYLQRIANGKGNLYNGATVATINDYFGTDNILALGSYNEDVQALQMFLYARGYDISAIDGLFDRETCLALQQFQRDNNLKVSDDADCVFDEDTMNAVNQIIRDENYLGSGFIENENGYLEGTENFKGLFGPGTIDFTIPDAEARGLKEGDIVLMYTFLDEKTLLVTTHESVITEVVKRRAFNDIFNQR